MCKSVSKEGLFIGKIEVVDSSQEAAPQASSTPKATPTPTPAPAPTPTPTQGVATPAQNEPEIKSRRGSAGGGGDGGGGGGNKKAAVQKKAADNTAVRDKLTELIEQIQMEEAAHRSGN